MRLSILLLLITCQTTVVLASKNDSLIHALDKMLEQKASFTQKKIDQIAALKEGLRHAGEHERFNYYARIYESYKTFVYDSAFLYARILRQEAQREHDPVKISYARIKLSFALLSSGMFKEAIDTLNAIRAKTLPDSLKSEYYSLAARTYFDLVDFNKDEYYTERYMARGNLYVDSALRATTSGTIDFALLEGQKSLKTLHWNDAREIFERLLRRESLTDHQIGIAASTLGYIYLETGNRERAMECLAEAAIADIRSSTKETLAILNLAEILYKGGEVKLAYSYVKQAMDDANFYGARHRKIQVASIFPQIEGDELNTVEAQRRMLFLYAIAVTALTVLLIVLALIILKQFKRLQAAKVAISSANERLQAANDKLQNLNDRLMEANKIKEEYVGYYFNINTDYLEKIEGFKRSIDNKLMARKFDDIRFVVNSLNMKKEREELYVSFDKVFVKLFPDFVPTFNSFFKEEDRLLPKDGQLLTTEMRIFALIRMGIHDTEKIAKILDYSVNTIYSYKTRVKSKSIVPNDEFEQRIMDIRAI